MQLANAEEVHHLTVQVVQDLRFRRRFSKKNLPAAQERFDVRVVLREYRNDLIRQRVFAADVGEGPRMDVGRIDECSDWRFDSTFLHRSVNLAYAITSSIYRWDKFLRSTIRCRS